MHIFDATHLAALLRTEAAEALLRGRDPTPLTQSLTNPAKICTLSSLHSDWITQIEWAPASVQSLLSSSLDGTIRVTPVELPGNKDPVARHRPTYTLRSAAGKGVRTFLVTSLAPGRLRCASGGLERSVNVWSLENGELVGCLIGHHTSVTHLCLAPARKSGGSAPLHEPDLLISLDTQGTIRTWDLGMLIPVQCITHLHGAPERPTALVYDPLQALLITVSKRPVAWDRHADDSFGVGESGDDELATGASLPQLTSACVPRTLKAETARARAGCALLTESAFLLDKESEVAIPATVTNEELVAKVTPPLPGAGSEVPRRRHGGVTLSLYPGSAPLPCVSLANAAADWAPGRSQLGVHRPRQRPTRTLTRSASQPTRVLYRGLPLATSATAGGVLGRFNAAPRPLPSIATDGPDTLTRGASSPELLWRRGGTGSGHLARPALRRG